MSAGNVPVENNRNNSATVSGSTPLTPTTNYPFQPGTTMPVATGGYLCAACSMWVPVGSLHICQTQAFPTYPTRTPHKCPVCEGRKTVPQGFYTGMSQGTDTNRDQCQTCNGVGILWA